MSPTAYWAVLEEVQARQAWALDPVYPIIHFDCLFVKSREDAYIARILHDLKSSKEVQVPIRFSGILPVLGCPQCADFSTAWYSGVE